MTEVLTADSVATTEVRPTTAGSQDRAADAPPDLMASAERFFNRELSWLSFNERVFEEASNTAYPLLERLRFLAISADILDEFTMVRVAGLQGQVHAGVRKLSPDGRSPAEQLELINQGMASLLDRQQRRWKEPAERAPRGQHLGARSVHADRQGTPLAGPAFHGAAVPGADADRC